MCGGVWVPARAPRPHPANPASLCPPCPPPHAVCAAAGDAERAFQLYAEMREARVPPCKQVYATLIKACSEAISRAPPSDRRAARVYVHVCVGGVPVSASVLVWCCLCLQQCWFVAALAAALLC